MGAGAHSRLAPHISIRGGRVVRRNPAGTVRTMQTNLETRLAQTADTIGGALDGFGGYLRCETCGRRKPLGDPGKRVTRKGWPKCCSHTMRWWTQRQVDAGEDRLTP